MGYNIEQNSDTVQLASALNSSDIMVKNLTKIYCACELPYIEVHQETAEDL